MTEKYIFMMMGVVFFSKQNNKKTYNAKYQKTYGNRHHVLSAPNMKYARIRREYSGIKLKATGFLYLQGSPYRDSEGISQIISCINDAIINAAPIIVVRLTNWNCTDSVPLEG